MPLKANQEITINCPKQKVFEYVANFENYKKWFPGVVDIKSQNGLEHGSLGKEYLERVKVPFGKTKEIIIKVVESEQGEYLVTQAAFQPLLPMMRFAITENADKSVHLAWSFESRATNRLFRRLFLPYIMKLMQKRADIGMLELKRQLELQES